MSSTKPQTEALQPIVSVVIVNWNARDYLIQTLHTLFQESLDVAFDVIVVDNGSTDGSLEFVQQMWRQVRLVSLPRNVGFGAANNVGFQEAHGRYILVLNSDTIVRSTTLQGMVEFLNTHPDAGCVGCQHLNPDGTLQRSVDSFPTLLHDFLCFSDLYRLSVLQSFLQRHYAWWGPHDQIREVDWVNGSCMMVRREVIEQTGGFDTDFFIYAEEIDWCYRILKTGWRTYFTPEAEIIHVGGQSSKLASDVRLVLMYKGQYRFYRKHYSMCKYFALRIIVLLVALPRIAILLFLAVCRIKIDDSKWSILTQEPVQTEPFVMLRSWWRIIWIPSSKWSTEEKRLMEH